MHFQQLPLPIISRETNHAISKESDY